jgi:putative nucleotidyltransferase with HDIG domain
MENLTNRKKIASKIDNGEPIRLSFKYVNEKVLMVLNSILTRLLAKNDQIYLLNSVITILREIIINALKANAKRIFFNKENLDINNERLYKKGMNKFKQDVVGDFDSIESDLRRSDYHVLITFSLESGTITISVSNNSPILPIELERINYRIEKAIKYNDFSEAYAEIEDDTEGAGLGIVLTILLLKNMGIDARNYQIEKDGNSTRTMLTIPSALKPSEIVTRVKKQILSEIEGLPTFPQNIVQLQRLCNDPESSIDHIVRLLKVDPALSTDVIKLSNSAGIAPGFRIDDIKTAVVIIGLKNLNAILVASNARRILNERYSSFEMIWDHCNKVAFYAREIALTYRLNHLIESVYMAGLLHDLGKIVLLATDKKLVRKIANIVKDRKITTTTMEEISIGISHSTIGSLIAQKWNFPESLVEAIKFHHSPNSCSSKNTELVYIIYLANMMIGIEDRRYNYFYMDEGILERYDLLEIEKFNLLHERLKNKYESNKYV